MVWYSFRIKIDLINDICHFSNTRKYRVNNIPDNFLSDDAIRNKINETIYRIENAIHVENNVQSAYDDFCK
jgi:hypothetical protein